MFETDKAIVEARKRFLSTRAKWRRGTVDDAAVSNAAYALAQAYNERHHAWPLVTGYGSLCYRKYKQYTDLAWAFSRGEVAK